jgi:acrylyl-CoA reductase (NADPH)
MHDEKFTALQVDNTDGNYQSSLVDLTVDDLPDGDVLIDVELSGINYKDALAVTGKGKIIREFPFIPGVDFAGTVRESKTERFSQGDKVFGNGCGIGESVFGGYSQQARFKESVVYPIPDGLTALDVMKAGTAGFTAAMCVMALEERDMPKGDVVVSGASGGVGSYAIALLSGGGHRIVAVSRPAAETYLKKLGAAEILPREEMDVDSRPLERARWGGGVDAVGGRVLGRMLAQAEYGSTIACCGLAAGHALATTVMPFILRGVRLVGIESVSYPPERRMDVWKRLARGRERLEAVECKTVGLADIAECSEIVLSGDFQGRFVVDLGL